ncbi:hypothetical protein M0638_11990 [Roseomonas sp. NAR14]|uniref:Uncharacterized protein n=1 Tax=Roseomonas acroporae TaxID=2937791 RepID=A0A9X1YA01_9PROT|nr:hypothetical protein [Roseomonas acroporae]MCK8785105.1 hypothetical protein [Roseomonas acroporae]
MTFKPYEDEQSALTIGGLSLENHADRVSVFGSLDLTRDKAGLQAARDLARALEAVVKALEAARDLPETVPAPPAEAAKEDRTANPFG